MLLITAILLEVASWAYVALRLHIGYKDLISVKQEYIQNLPLIDTQIERASIFWNNNKLQLHPYFGFTNVPKSQSKINNLGFFTRKGEIYPYRSDKDEFVVGIFGGSVALQMFYYMTFFDYFNRYLLPLLKKKGYNRITTLNFAGGGGKHPQSLFILQYFIDNIDMAIFIEGFNEVSQFYTSEYVVGYPPDFPSWRVWGALAKKKYNPYMIQIIARLEMNKSKQEKITHNITSSIIGRSMFIHLLWKAYINSLKSEENQLRQKLLKENKESLKYENLFPEDFKYEDRVNFFFKKYENYIYMAHIIGQEYRVPCFFVIQPNQHFTGSKPLSKEELKKYISKIYGKVVKRLYPPLIKMYNRLSKRKLGSIDLSMVFSETHEITYKDACCHLNKFGGKVFGKAIMEEIIKRKNLLSIIPGSHDRCNRLFKSD